MAPARISLLVETNSLLLLTGNWPLQPWKDAGNSALFPAGESDIGEIPCTFPVDQGFRPRDEFATDWFHRHFVDRQLSTPVDRCPQLGGCGQPGGVEFRAERVRERDAANSIMRSPTRVRSVAARMTDGSVDGRGRDGTAGNPSPYPRS